MNRLKSTLVSIMQASLLIMLAPADLYADGNERFLQFGLFPPVSSNGLNAGKTVNAVSVNLIGGFNAGNRIFELGSVWNASRDFTQGLQLAGMVNYSGCSLNAAQISGAVNIAAAGNSPLQLAGLANIGENINGPQLSALLNVAKSVRGVQIGLVNYMEDGGKGVSIGLINIARHNGKYEFEVSFSEAVNILLSFRMGTDRFYTIFSGGVNCFSSALEYAAGMGFGTSIKWKKNWSNHIEIQAFGLSEGKKFTNGSVKSIIQLRLPVCKELARHFKIFAGPAVNLGLQNTRTSGDTSSYLSPWPMWTARTRGLLAEGWIGVSAGIRF